MCHQFSTAGMFTRRLETGYRKRFGFGKKVLQLTWFPNRVMEPESGWKTKKTEASMTSSVLKQDPKT